jgi:hypothetical protein
MANRLATRIARIEFRAGVTRWDTLLNTPFEEWPEGELVGLLRAFADCIPAAQLAVARISDDRLAGLIEMLKQAGERCQ